VHVNLLRFPSASFPGADLRVSSDTDYECRCVSCDASFVFRFGWLLEPPYTSNNATDPQLHAAILDHLSDNPNFSMRGSHPEIAQCPSCGTAYVIYVNTEETHGSYRVKVMGVAKVEAREDL
jgi:hypothetical protein